MKLIATIFVSAVFSMGQAHAMTRVDAPGTANGAVPATPTQVQQGGKLETIYAAASKLVIGGVTYAYNPLTTVVMINGKRSTISDLRVGETLRFQTSSQGANRPELLTSIQVQR